ncbi:hypothetical protein D9M72_644230 [compost metagenome]
MSMSNLIGSRVRFSLERLRKPDSRKTKSMARSGAGTAMTSRWPHAPRSLDCGWPRLARTDAAQCNAELGRCMQQRHSLTFICSRAQAM